MTDTTTPAELEIPQAAVEAYFVCGCSESGIRAGYKPEALSVVVAAELRRFATEIANDAGRIKRSLPSNGATYSDIDRADLGRVIQGEDDARMLRARADELDPQP